MPSSLMRNSLDGPVVKRQRLNGNDASRSALRESKIFAPFRVRHAIHSIDLLGRC